MLFTGGRPLKSFRKTSEVSKNLLRDEEEKKEPTPKERETTKPSFRHDFQDVDEIGTGRKLYENTIATLSKSEVILSFHVNHQL